LCYIWLKSQWSGFREIIWTYIILIYIAYTRRVASFYYTFTLDIVQYYTVYARMRWMPKFQRVFNPSAVSLCATRRDGTVWARKNNVVVAPVHYYTAMARQEEVRWRYVGFRRPVVWRRRPRLSHTRLATVGPFLVPSLYREKKNRFDSSRTDTTARVSQYTPCTRVQQVGWYRYTRVLCIRYYGGHRIINY